MSDVPLLVTCVLPYTNGPCHIGHLRTYVPADFFVRFMRRSGEEVVFVCGSDNHGTPIVLSAEAEGTTPREMSERYHQIRQRAEIRDPRVTQLQVPQSPHVGQWCQVFNLPAAIEVQVLERHSCQRGQVDGFLAASDC